MLKGRPLRHVVAVVALVMAAWVAVAGANHALLVDKGGRVLATPQVSAIYLGDYWVTQQGAADMQRNDSFLQTWLAGPAISGVLAQYRVTAASFTSSEILQGLAPFQFTDDDARALVQQELAAGRIIGGDQAVHVIYLPPGTILTFQGNSSDRKLAGYHSSYLDPVTGQPVYYAVVVYNQGTNGLDFTGNPQDNLSIIGSRVLANAFTNPDAGQGTAGWIDDVNGEVGDIAFALSADAGLGDTFTTQDGFAVVLLFSNKDDKLDAGTAAATPPPATSTLLSVAPGTQTVAPGTSGTFTVTNAATATEALQLTADQLPANVTATFTDTLLAPGASTTLTVTVDAAATAATSTFTVTGTGAATSDSVPVTLTIGTPGQAPAPQADFSMTVTPTSQDMIRRGPAVTYTITTQGDANVTIKLKTLHARRGLQVTLSKTRVAAGETVTLTVRAHRDARRRTYDLELKGSSDQADVLIPFTLTLK